MIKSLRLKDLHLLRAFSVYSISQILNKGIGFLLLPVFTTYLSTYDFGVISLYTTLQLLFTILISMGSDSGIRRQYFALEGSRFNDYVKSSLLLPVVSTVCFTIIFYVFSDVIGHLMKVDLFWMLMLPAISLAGALMQIQSGLFRVKEEASLFGVFNLGYVIVNISLGILLVVSFKMGFEGRLWGILIGQIAFAFLSYFLLQRSGHLGGAFNKVDLKHAVAYGLPLIPHQIGAFVVNSSNRFFISEMISVEQLGVYSVAYTIGGLMLIIQDSFVNAFVPYLFKKLKLDTDQDRKSIVKVSYVFAAALLISFLILCLVTPFIYQLFIDQKFHSGITIVYWIALGYLFLGLYKVFTGYLFYYQKTSFLMYFSVTNVVVNAVLNYVLILAFGLVGAAIATCIAYCILFLLAIPVANRIKKMPWFYFIKR